MNIKGFLPLFNTSTAHLSVDIFVSCNKKLTVSIAALAQSSQKPNTFCLSLDHKTNKIRTYPSSNADCARRESADRHTPQNTFVQHYTLQQPTAILYRRQLLDFHLRHLSLLSPPPLWTLSQATTPSRFPFSFTTTTSSY